LKPLRVINAIEDVALRDSSFLGFMEKEEKPVSRHIRYLSQDGNLTEAAANFFSHLIDLDREDIDIIYAERVPELGLGKAMMDRLRKAARKCVP
jgi:L-threonylcarbamoyladenylate synthase